MLKSSCVILQRPFSCSGNGRNISVLLLIAMIKRPQYKQFRLERGDFGYNSRVVYVIAGKSRQWKHETACHTHIKSSVGMLACAQLSSAFKNILKFFQNVIQYIDHILFPLRATSLPTNFVFFLFLKNKMS